jgi:hypothetical protein
MVPVSWLQGEMRAYSLHVAGAGDRARHDVDSSTVALRVFEYPITEIYEKRL